MARLGEVKGVRGFIQHVDLLWGGELFEKYGLRVDTNVTVTGVLIVRPNDLYETLLGDVVFNYQGNKEGFGEAKTVGFAGAVRGLMDRYHGLTQLSALRDRLQMVISPEADWDVALASHNGFGHSFVPFTLEENRAYALKHIPPVGAPQTRQSFVVEIQGFVKIDTRGYARMSNADDARPYVLFQGR